MVKLLTAFSLHHKTIIIPLFVKSIANIKGNTKIGIYYSAKSFYSYTKKHKEIVIIPLKLGMTYTFKNIAVSISSIAVWQDKKNNKETDKNWLSIPL